jgi:hypothetical protein
LIVRLFTLIACALFLTACSRQGPEVKPEYDQLTDTSGAKFIGLIVKETPEQVEFQYVNPRAGVRTLVFDVVFARDEIASLVKGREPGRSEAQRRFAAFKTARIREEEAVRQVRLTTVPWVTGEGTSWRHESAAFTLQSDGDEAFVRLVCVRLGEIFAAYRKDVPSRVATPKPTRILLFRSLAGFRDWQLKRGITLLNPAVYDPKANEITVGCDLERLSSLRAGIGQRHDQKLKEITELRDKLIKHFQGRPPASQVKQILQARSQIIEVNDENAVTYAKLESGFFGMLYHEAFHAYLDNAVYPSQQYEVPRWLNEGLAQLFENAFVEIGELQIGRMDEKRLQNIQDAVRRGRFMTLREILQAPPDQFFVRHTQEQFEADRQYDAAWALAHFLKNDVRVLDAPMERLTEYVSTARQAGQELRTFEKLVGMSIDECERKWRDYLLRLRVDGTLRASSP